MLSGGGHSQKSGVNVDDLQGILLQVTLAIMMIFMIAFFIFRIKTENGLQQQVMALTRQKLSLACDQVESEFRSRYGLDVLLRGEGETAKFKPETVINGTAITSDPTVRAAFRDGGMSAAGDYAYPERLSANWRSKVLAVAEIQGEELPEAEADWLKGLIDQRTRLLRDSVYNVQRSCAARLQRTWLSNPSRIGDSELAALVGRLKGVDESERLRLATEISSTLKTRSLMRIAELGETELLP